MNILLVQITSCTLVVKTTIEPHHIVPTLYINQSCMNNPKYCTVPYWNYDSTDIKPYKQPTSSLE